MNQEPIIANRPPPSDRTLEMLDWRKTSFDQLAAAKDIATDQGMTLTNCGDLHYDLTTKFGTVSWFPATRRPELQEWPEALRDTANAKHVQPIDLLTFMEMVLEVLAEKGWGG